MIRNEPIRFQAQNAQATVIDTSDKLCGVSVPVEIVTHIFTFLTENSKNLLNLRSVCSRFKAIIETDGNCKRFFKMSTSRDPLFQNSTKIPNYLSKFLLHLTPLLSSQEGFNRLLVRPSFKDRFAITILNLFLQKVLKNPVSSADKQALLKKIDYLKTRLFILIEIGSTSTNFELQEKQNQEIINPLLKLFIKLGVDPTAINYQTNRSLLRQVADLQNAEGIEIILKALKNEKATDEELTKKLNTHNAEGIEIIVKALKNKKVTDEELIKKLNTHNTEGINIILKALKNKKVTDEELIKKLNTQNAKGINIILEALKNKKITDEELIKKLNTQNIKGINIVLEALKKKKLADKELIKKLNMQDTRGETILHHLANSVDTSYFNQNKMEKTLRLLLDHGADLYVKNWNGETALRNFQTVKEFKRILKNISPDYEIQKKSEKPSSQSKELHAAIKQGNKDKIKELLEKDEQLVDDWDFYEITPLKRALDCGDLEIIELILSYNPNFYDNDRRTIFDYCVTTSRLKAKAKANIFKELIRSASIMEYDDIPLSKGEARGHYTLLSIAITDNSDPLELVQVLLPYYRGKINEKPYLSMAACENQIEVVRLLMEEGAEINSEQLYRSLSPLYWAVFNRNVEMTRLLLEFNKDPHEVNANHKDGRTILHVATTNMHLEMMEFLLSQEGINLHAQDDQGHTPLDIAIESEYYEGAKLLIERGAQIKLDETSKILSEEGPYLDELRHYLLYVFIKNKDLDSLQLLLNSPFDLQITTINKKFGKSPIMYAKEIDPKIVQMIYRLILNKSNKSGNYSS
ncbi:ankyrin repeat domain-containing protein [Candidatus Protochlamydia sp. W-9]|uniref:ankyrin repeat domain-containing protein n=1 Tax=Candidatus Protochlamydia sp. W-9 TaxID=1785087 RepID=UPI00096AA626|nr:ankyrin repeat domain-containing protein [Candidatus Protochlamydia sp. W-9]